MMVGRRKILVIGTFHRGWLYVFFSLCTWLSLEYGVSRVKWDVDTFRCLSIMSVCESGGRNPVPYQESRAV
jgi:hypothetical protein